MPMTDEHYVVIQTRYEQDFKEIVQECRRSNIQYRYDHSKEIPYGYYRIIIEEVGPKVQKLRSWTIRKFNTQARLKN